MTGITPLASGPTTTTLRPRLTLGSLILLGLLGLLGPGTLAQAASKPAEISDIDRILAIVNEDVITETELAGRLDDTKKQLSAEKIKLPPDAVLRKQLLERLVMEHIQLQLAAQTGIRVSDADVDQTFQTIARRNNLSPEALLKKLQQEGLNPDAYRAELRRQVIIQQLQEREVGNRVTVTEAEIAGFLESQESRSGVNVEYNLSHIFITIPENASPEAIQAAKKRAEDIHAQLARGGDFEQAALAYSQGAEALKGGNLGWKKSGQLPELFVAALKTLRPGAVTEALRSPNGFHLVRLNDRRGDVQTQAVTQTQARHILLKPSEILSPEDAKTKLRQLRERVENGDDFALLARAHSEDAGSAANGGDLGWVNPGQMVPEFEKAMHTLKPGELSQPVASPFGWHLIQVLARRDRDVSQERLHSAARQQIHARKADERFEQWVRQLRDEAYVEYLLDETN
jgi:peptidyl-prolyl cis-trans isomerase SurA